MSTKRMNLPIELWQIDMVESWLIDQAQNGWILEKMNGPSMTFQKAEPQNLEYRVIVMPEKKSTPTNTRELEQAGWHYVASYQYYHIFCSQQAGATTEIEKDLMKQAQSLSEWVTYYRFENVTKYTHTAFDQVLVEQIHEDTIHILTLKNQRVQYVDYQGEANVETILNALGDL